MVYAQPRICPREWDAQTPLTFRDTNGSLNLGQMTRSYNNQPKKKKKKKRKKKKGTCRIVDSAVPADHRVKLKECEVRDRYHDFARELKKLWNMKVTIIRIVIGALGTVTKVLVQGLEDLEITGRVETIQTTALLRSARIMRRVLETRGDLLSLKPQWETINLRWFEKLSKESKY